MPIPVEVEVAVQRVREAGGAFIGMFEHDDREPAHIQQAKASFNAAMAELDRTLSDHWIAKKVTTGQLSY
jgi:hypothetical protein